MGTKLWGSRSSVKARKRAEWVESRGGSAIGGAGAAVGPCTIVGGGRIGSLLAGTHPGNKLIGRNDAYDDLPPGPIYVATRNDALDGVVDKCPDERLGDLVFLQNGYIDEWLKGKGLEKNTQALLFFAVAKLGEEPTDGVTRVNPEGLTAVTGKHAEDLKARLEEVGLKCNVLGEDDYAKAMWEKLAWITGYMLVGTAKGMGSVGETGEKQDEILSELFDEMFGNVEGIEWDDKEAVKEKLRAYTEVVAHFPCGVKEFEWRNKVWYGRGLDKHDGLIKECIEAGTFALTLTE
ncbi:hypothetical protein TrCOL_g2774 [Triparma columacea]|uniref:Uncharacterized protein n=1 Tax=Triparma columacea TaxID=722753 RepID=A0A9W7LE49_9STRA|nr:hypothetical protein TrCOL_g2774 [Triparma columacea]